MADVTSKRISDVRITPDNLTVLKQLGLLQDLAGTWKGKGFNLIARPDFHDKTDLYLQLNQTRETLKFDPIGSSIPNRGFGQDDIELFGLTYLQQISDAGCTYRLFKRECVGRIKLYRGLHRFIPTLLKMEGYTVAEIAVTNNPRIHGESKYGVWNRLFKSFRDLLAIRWMKSRLLGYQVGVELDRGAEMSASGEKKVGAA